MLALGGGRRVRRLVCVALVAGGLLVAHGTAPAVTAKPKAAPAQDTTLMIGTPCSVTARACVDLTTQKAWLFKGNAIERGPVDITSGGPGKETPTGNFTVAWKDRNHVNPELTPMPYSVFFAVGGVAFHGGSLQKQSAGCVHLDLDDAIIFYDSLTIGAPVQVRGVAPAGIADSNGDLSRPRSSRRGADLPSDGPPIQQDSSPPSSTSSPAPSRNFSPSSGNPAPSRNYSPSSTSSPAPSRTFSPSSVDSGPSSESAPDDLLAPAGG